MRHVFLMLLSALLLHPVRMPAQSIVRVVRDYVLIDTDGLGDKDDLLFVVRLQNGIPRSIGRIRILAVRQGKTAARIVRAEPGFTFRPGDRVQKSMAGTDPLAALLNDPAMDSGFAERGPLGIYAGRIAPGSGLELLHQSGFALGISWRMFRAGRHHFSGEFVYPFMPIRPAAGSGLKSSLYSLFFMDHFRVGKRIHWDAGAGWVRRTVAYDALPEASVSRSHFGFQAGFSLDIPAGSVVLSPGVRYFAYQHGSAWQEGLFFGLTTYWKPF